jgi:hypothetical protein
MALDRANQLDLVQQIALSAGTGLAQPVRASTQDGLSSAKPIISKKMQLMGIASLYLSYALFLVPSQSFAASACRQP